MGMTCLDRHVSHEVAATPQLKNPPPLPLQGYDYNMF